MVAANFMIGWLSFVNVLPPFLFFLNSATLVKGLQSYFLFFVLPVGFFYAVVDPCQRSQGRVMPWFANHFPYFSIMRAHIGLSVKFDNEVSFKAAEAKPGYQAIYAVFPHGVGSDFRVLLQGMLPDFLPNTAHKVRTLAASMLFLVPGLRFLTLATGCVDASRATAVHNLKKGNSLMVVSEAKEREGDELIDRAFAKLDGKLQHCPVALLHSRPAPPFRAAHTLQRIPPVPPRSACSYDPRTDLLALPQAQCREPIRRDMLAACLLFAQGQQATFLRICFFYSLSPLLFFSRLLISPLLPFPPPPPFSALQLPGGEAEQLLTETGKELIYVKSRKGFVRLGMAHGTAVVPCYVFGCTDLYTTSKKFYDLRHWLMKNVHVCTGPDAKGLLGACPFPVKNTVVIGDPMFFTTKDKGVVTKEELDEAHGKFVEATKALFDKHKKKLGYGDRELVVI